MPPNVSRSFEPEDILSFKVVSDIDLSADGRWIVYALREIDPESDEYVVHLWLLSADGGSPRQLTFGADRNESARFSPDSTQIAFLSDRNGGKSQLYVMRVDGGEARPMTSLAGGAGEPVWSPDGASILFAAPVAQKGARTSPKVVTRALYKNDGAGIVAHRKTHLFVVPAAGGETRQLTSGDVSASDPAWSPDGRSDVFSRRRTGPRDAHRRDLWLMAADGSALRQVTHTCATTSLPSWSPDGSRIAFYGPREEGNGRYRLWLVGADGSKERPLISEDMEIAKFPLGRTAPPVWSKDGSEIAVVLGTRSVCEVARIQVAHGEIRRSISDDRQITMLSAAPRAGRIAFLWSDTRLCGMLGVTSWDGSGQQRLLNVNQDWAEEHVWPEATLREFESGSGSNRGLLLRPPGGGKGPMPLLVDVHGGPASHVSFGFPYHPYWYALTTRGWAVLALNPLGSATFGAEFVEALRGHWGERDLPEHLATVNALIEEGIADPDRIAIAGKSYGGYMTAWAIGHTRRFRAAICSAPVINLESHLGTSDSGYYVDPYQMRGTLSEMRKRYHDLSPLQYADQAETPTLILHGEKDQRCPIGQSEELFTSLICAGKAPVEFVRYPGGNHHLAETGKPSHRVDYNRRIIDWLETHCAMTGQ